MIAKYLILLAKLIVSHFFCFTIIDSIGLVKMLRSLEILVDLWSDVWH